MISFVDGELILDSYKTWGYDRQFDLVVEDLANLISAVKKWQRAPFDYNLEDLARKTANVEIRIKQLVRMMDQGELCKMDEFMSHLEALRSHIEYDLTKQLDPTEEAE